MPGLVSRVQHSRGRPDDARPKVDPEAERLHALLVETLRELEALRALLP